jgi:hypothetical protein
MARILAAPPYNRIVYVVNFSRLDWLALRDPNFGPALDTLAATVQIALHEPVRIKLISSGIVPVGELPAHTWPMNRIRVFAMPVTRSWRV